MSAAVLVPLQAHLSWRELTPSTWVLFGCLALFVAWTIWRTVHLTLHPGEREPEHIKRQILREPTGVGVVVSSVPGQSATPASRGGPAATKD